MATYAARFKDYQTYQGYRVVAVDGSCLNLARDPAAPTFMCHAGAPEGYNQLKITVLYDVLNKCYLSSEIQPAPEQDEIGALDFLLTWYDFDDKTLMLDLIKHVGKHQRSWYEISLTKEIVLTFFFGNIYNPRKLTGDCKAKHSYTIQMADPGIYEKELVEISYRIPDLLLPNFMEFFDFVDWKM